MTAQHRLSGLDGSEPVDILIVDDRQENLLALEAILEPLEQHVIRASSGEEALRILLSRDVAVILLDVQMPGMNGFETAQMIKSRERSKFIPIIFLTAISKEEEYVFRGYSVGAVDYLFKPFQPDILRSKVSVFVDLALKQRQLGEQEQQLREHERRELELRHMRELWESEARFADIVRSAMDAIIVFRDDGQITSFNAAAERMFCDSSESAIGSHVARFFGGSDHPETLEQLRCAADGNVEGVRATGDDSKSPPTVTLSGCRVTTSESFPIEFSASSIQTAEGRAYTLIVRDISERVANEERLRRQAETLERSASELRELNEELERRQGELEKAMTARSRFYASMSHELRTPINAILGYSTLLLENIYGPLNEKQAEGIQRTNKAAKHLLELVNDVLDLSKIEAGKFDLRIQPVQFPALVEDLFVTVRPLADQHGSTLTLDMQPDSHRIISDPRRIRQILLNLLSNAIKFGKGQPIDVRVRATEDGGALLEVQDRGEGIPEADQLRIFEEFVQLGKSQLTEGTGLGLPISRRLAEMLHGSLEVQSEVGEGSTFRLTLPATLDAPRELARDQFVRTPVDRDNVPARPAAEHRAEPASAAGRRTGT